MECESPEFLTQRLDPRLSRIRQGHLPPSTTIMYVNNPPTYRSIGANRLVDSRPSQAAKATYSRRATTDNRSACSSDAARPIRVISEKGQKIIDAHMAVLRQCANGMAPPLPGKQLMNDYFVAIIENDPNPDRVEMASSLDFLRNTKKFGTSQRELALKTALRKFDFGVEKPGFDKDILSTLKNYCISSDSFFLAGMTAAWPRTLFNSDAMKALHGAAREFVRNHGNIMQVDSEKAEEFLGDLVRRHVSDDATRHSLEVLLTRSKGYTEQRKGDEIIVLHNPDGLTTAELKAQAAQGASRPLLPQPSDGRKRSAGAMEPLDPADGHVASKHRMVGMFGAPPSSRFPAPPNAGDGLSQRPLQVAFLFPTGRDQNLLPLEQPDRHRLPLPPASVGGVHGPDQPPSRLQVVEHCLSTAPSLLARPVPDEAWQVLHTQLNTAPGTVVAREPVQIEVEDISLDADASDRTSLSWEAPSLGGEGGATADLYSSGRHTVATTTAVFNPLTLSTDVERSRVASGVDTSSHTTQAQLASTDAALRAEKIRELIEYLKAPPSPDDMASGASGL